MGVFGIGKMAIGHLPLVRTQVRRGDVADSIIARLTIRTLKVERVR